MYCIFVLAAKRVATIIITIPPTISEDIKVKNAELNNGLLNIDLERIVPEEKKSRLIEIK